MISEFQELSDKIDRLAESAMDLRRENAYLRQKNARLHEDYMACKARMDEAQVRLNTLLGNFLAPESELAGAAVTDDEVAP
jgi:cell division protein ZapB